MLSGSGSWLYLFGRGCPVAFRRLPGVSIACVCRDGHTRHDLSPIATGVFGYDVHRRALSGAGSTGRSSGSRRTRIGRVSEPFRRDRLERYQGRLVSSRVERLDAVLTSVYTLD